MIRRSFKHRLKQVGNMHFVCAVILGVIYELLGENVWPWLLEVARGYDVGVGMLLMSAASEIYCLKGLIKDEDTDVPMPETMRIAVAVVILILLFAFSNGIEYVLVVVLQKERLTLSAKDFLLLLLVLMVFSNVLEVHRTLRHEVDVDEENDEY